MNSLQLWGTSVSGSLLDVWGRFVSFLPAFVGALLVFFLGLIIATALGKAVERLLKIARVDEAFAKIGFSQAMKSYGLVENASQLLGGIVKWVLVLVFLMAATDVLGLNQVTSFLDQILFYIPNLVVAMIILAVALIVANFVENIVRSSAKTAEIVSASFLGVVAKWAIVIFGVLAALIQLGIVESLANTLFIGFVGALSLALGLAFGLGGKDEAALLLKRLREKLEEK